MTRRHHCPMLPLARWPAAENRRWSTAKSRNRPARDGYGRDPTWSAAYWEKQEEAYGGFLGWLLLQGSSDPREEPGQRCTPQRLKAYVEFLLPKVSPATANNRIEHLRRALKVLGAKPDSRSFRNACHHLRRRARQAKRSDPPPPDRALKALGLKLMALADANYDPRRSINAVIYRDGLLIAAMSHRPLRRSNWAELIIDVDLILIDGIWWIVPAHQKVKKRPPIPVRWPVELQGALQRYLSVYRPLLTGSQSKTDHLWMTYRRKPEAPSTMSLAVARRTKAEFGRAWRPHAFRRAVASCAGTVTEAATLLGNTPAIAEKSYRHARRQIALQEHLELLQQHRDALSTISVAKNN